MLNTLEAMPADSILGLAAACRRDPHPQKVDLTVGIYMDETGLCPVFDAVRAAQRALIEEETTKAYMPPAGDEAFNLGIRQLVLAAENSGRVSSVQSPGGCGALRLGAELVFAAAPGARVWISDPTWPVHIPLLGSVGLKFETYRYYQAEDHSVDFGSMVEDLSRASRGDVVLLHGCCHNPSGADLDFSQWQTIAEMAQKQGFLPFVDMAYQGLGDDLDTDAAGVRLLVSVLPEVLVAVSCSKNMGLYRERTGAILFACANPASAEVVHSQALTAARRLYSMPPAHGAILAGRVLADTELTLRWREELAAMCGRINRLRATLRARLEAVSGLDFSFIEREKGMFSFLGLSREQVLRLREEHSVYMLDSSRINVAGVNAKNLDYLADSVARVLSSSA